MDMDNIVNVVLTTVANDYITLRIPVNELPKMLECAKASPNDGSKRWFTVNSYSIDSYGNYVQTTGFDKIDMSKVIRIRHD